MHFLDHRVFLSNSLTDKNSVCWRYTWQLRLFVHALLSRMLESPGRIQVSLQSSFHTQTPFHFLSPEPGSAARWTDESRPAPCPGPTLAARSSPRRILCRWCPVFPQCFCTRLHAAKRNWWRYCERGTEARPAPGPSLIYGQDSLGSGPWCVWSIRRIC